MIPAAELRWRFSRSSGPGGQNVNTTDSRVELLFDLATTPSLPPHLQARALRRLEGKLVEGCVVIAASEHRSQWQNRVAAQRRLVERRLLSRLGGARLAEVTQTDVRASQAPGVVILRVTCEVHEPPPDEP